jgi:hypothetical protein
MPVVGTPAFLPHVHQHRRRSTVRRRSRVPTFPSSRQESIATLMTVDRRNRKEATALRFAFAAPVPTFPLCAAIPKSRSTASHIHFSGCHCCIELFVVPILAISSPSFQPVERTALNLLLDKYQQARYYLVKVLLTVSPFRSSFSPALNPFPFSPQELSPLSTVFTPNRPLTPLSTAFTQNDRGVGCSAVSAFGDNEPQVRNGESQVTPFHIIATSYVALCSVFATSILCFQQLARSFAKTPGWGGTSATSQGRDIERHARDG